MQGLYQHRILVTGEIKWRDIPHANDVISIIHCPRLKVQFHITGAVGSPLGIIRDKPSRGHTPHLVSGHKDVFLDDLPGGKLDIWSSLADHDPSVSMSDQQPGFCIKLDAVRSFQGKFESFLVFFYPVFDRD